MGMTMDTPVILATHMEARAVRRVDTVVRSWNTAGSDRADL